MGDRVRQVLCAIQFHGDARRHAATVERQVGDAAMLVPALCQTVPCRNASA